MEEHRSVFLQFIFGFNMLMPVLKFSILFSIIVSDVLLWKRWQVSFGVIVVSTVAWLLLEWTDLPFLTICSDVLLLLIVLLFLNSNYAALRNKYDC